MVQKEGDRWVQGIWMQSWHSSRGIRTLCREGYKEMDLWLWSTWVWQERDTKMWVWVMVHTEEGIDRAAGNMNCGTGANINETEKGTWNRGYSYSTKGRNGRGGPCS